MECISIVYIYYSSTSPCTREEISWGVGREGSLHPRAHVHGLLEDLRHTEIRHQELWLLLVGTRQQQVCRLDVPVDDIPKSKSTSLSILTY